MHIWLCLVCARIWIRLHLDSRETSKLFWVVDIESNETSCVKCLVEHFSSWLSAICTLTPPIKIYNSKKKQMNIRSVVQHRGLRFSGPANFIKTSSCNFILNLVKVWWNESILLIVLIEISFIDLQRLTILI